MNSNDTPPSGITMQVPGYTIMSELGKGGMATVYLAIQECFGRKVALKVMSPSLLADPTFGERFLREARIVARLSHPHIVAVYEVGVHEDHHFIAMEYHPGGDLQAKITKGLTPEESVSIVQQIALALDTAHSKGYIHRDVKPDNILFREDGSAVLTDFGIAKPEKTTKQMTQVGKVVGTPKYMSPEQARGAELDSRSDIYALGIVLYESLTGTVPFDADDPIAIGIQHLKDPVPDLPAHLAAFDPVVKKVLAKEPGDRYQHGQELIDALDEVEFLHADGSIRAPGGKVVKTPSGRSKRIGTTAGAMPAKNKTPIMIGAAAVVLAAVIGLPPFLAPDNPTVQQIYGLDSTQVSVAPASKPKPQKSKPAPQLAANQPEQTLPEETAVTAVDVTTPAETLEKETPVSAVTTAPETVTADASAATNPSAPASAPAEVVENPLEPLIQQLLKEAEEAVASNRLTRPTESSALGKYKEVLEMDPENTEAVNGIRKLATLFIVKAREAKSSNQFSTARRHLAKAEEIDPGVPGLASARNAINEAQAEAKAQAQAEAERKAAEANKAETFAARFRITGLLKSAEQNMLQGKYTLPSDDNALVKFREVLKLDPKNAQAAQGIRSIRQRLPEAARQAIETGDPSANNLIEQLELINPNQANILRQQL